MNIEFRKMLKEHLEAVRALEVNCQLSSRGEDGFSELLQDDRWLLWVALQSSDVVGFFMGIMVVDELQIDNIAVSASSRQQGIASKLLAVALENAKRKGMLHANLEVRAGNLPAIKLYQRHGFAVVGRRKDYYQNPLEDALLMSLFLGEYS